MHIDTQTLPDMVLTTVLKKVVNWSRRSSLWPMPFATACCGIELMATASSRYDLARFGAEAMRFSPRQSDLLIVAGRVTIKMMPVLQHIYQQMTEPKWVISMGACASTGGVFDTYSTIQGIDQFMPVDVYVPGCPPRPETLIEGIMAIQRIIDEDGLPPAGATPAAATGGRAELQAQPATGSDYRGRSADLDCAWGRWGSRQSDEPLECGSATTLRWPKPRVWKSIFLRLHAMRALDRPRLFDALCPKLLKDPQKQYVDGLASNFSHLRIRC